MILNKGGEVKNISEMAHWKNPLKKNQGLTLHRKQRLWIQQKEGNILFLQEFESEEAHR